MYMIVHKNCFILHFYTSCHIKENCVEVFFFLFFFLFYSLVRNENIKRLGFYLKKLSKIKNKYEYCDFMNCDLLVLEMPDSYKKTYCDYVSFRFF